MATGMEKDGSNEAVQVQPLKAEEPKVAATETSQTDYKRKRKQDASVVDDDTEGEDVAMDDTNWDTDDEEVTSKRRNNGQASKLGNGGLILVLFEVPSGFAIFSYDEIKLLEPNACQNIWVDFTDLTVAGTTVCLQDFQAFGDKLSTINATNCSEALANMIKKHIVSGQKLAVGNEVYKKTIENSLKISCLYDTAVEELMWGLKVQMPYLVPPENPELAHLFPMSKGMRWLLDFYSFEFKPNMMVTREIIRLAGVLFECDRWVDKHYNSLRSGAELFKEISHIDPQDWDLLKFATALKMICYPKETVEFPPWLFSKQELVRMCKDAPKYEGKLLKTNVLEIYNDMRLAIVTRRKVIRILSHLLCRVTKAQESDTDWEEEGSKHRGFGEELALSSFKRKRQVPPTLVSPDVLQYFTCICSHPLHRMNEPGILSMHIHPSKDIVATGGADTNAVLFHKRSGQILCTLTGHSKKITSLKFVNRDEVFITGSADKTVRMWKGSEDGKYSHIHTLKDHNAEVEAVTVHVSQNYFVTASKDNSWRFYDIFTGSCLTQVGEGPGQEGYTSASFHPDGFLLGTGTATAVVKIWDVWSKTNFAKLEGHFGPVTAMSFSQNGYLLATAALDGVKLWDIRKMRNLRTISPNRNTPVNAVDFDLSGRYLAIGSSDIRIYQDTDEFEAVAGLPLPGTVTSLMFGPRGDYIAVGSVDPNLRIFGLDWSKKWGEWENNMCS